MNVTNLLPPIVLVVLSTSLMPGAVCETFIKDARKLIFVLTVASLRILVYIALAVQSTVGNSPGNVLLIIVSRVYVLIAAAPNVRELIVSNASNSIAVIAISVNLRPLNTRLKHAMVFAVVFVVRKQAFAFTILMNKVRRQLQENVKSQTMSLIILLRFVVAVMALSPVSLIHPT